jgi:hypothetical protein
VSKKFLVAVLAVLTVVALIAASGASAAETEDTTPPEILGLSFSTNEVDVTESSQEVTITAQVKDDLSGVQFINVVFFSPARPEPQSASASLALVEGDTYRGTLTIPRFAEAGEWEVWSLATGDRVGNDRELRAGQLKELGLPYSIRVSGKSDTAAPEITSLSITPTEVDVTEASQTVTITAHVDDELSGVQFVNVVLASPARPEPQTSSGGLALIEGDTYRGTLTIPRFAEAGEWEVESLAAGDHVGNSRELRTAELKDLGMPYSIQVRGTSDTTPPEILGLSFSTNEVDVTESSKEVTITAQVKDDLSGVQFINVFFFSPARPEPQSASASLALVEGDTYRGTLTIPRFAEAGEWEVWSLVTGDRVGNDRELRAGQLKELGLPYSIRVREGEPIEEPVESSSPQMAELSFEPTEVDTTKAEVPVRVMAHIKSEAGLKQGYIEFHAPASEAQQVAFFERVSGTEFDGEYEAKVPFPQGGEAGKWGAEVWLGDHAGHESRIGPEGLDERGLPSSVFVIDGTEGPILEADELLFSPSEIDTSETEVPVSVFVHIEAEAGLAGGYVSFGSPSGETTVVAPLELEAGTEFSGAYNGVATFPQGSEPGEWFAELHLSDSAGHEVVLGPEQLSERGMPYEVTVLKPTSPPVVTGISPSSGPEAGGTPVHLVGSGFGGVTAVHFGEHLAEFVYESPESITAYAPPGTGNVGVVITTPEGTSGEVNYAYTPSVAVSLTSSPNPSVHGQKVTFTAIVEPAVKGGPTPLGTVTFREGTTTLGVANLSKGKATLNTTTLGAGEHPVSPNTAATRTTPPPSLRR